MNRNWSPYYLKIFWLVGLILLVSISSKTRLMVQQFQNETYNLVPMLWFESLSALAFGLYIAVLLVKKWIISMNWPLLVCITIPCIIFSTYYPVIATLTSVGITAFNIESSAISFWLYSMFSSPVVGFISGLTLLLSVFGARRLKNEK